MKIEMSYLHGGRAIFIVEFENDDEYAGEKILLRGAVYTSHCHKIVTFDPDRYPDRYPGPIECYILDKKNKEDDREAYISIDEYIKNELIAYIWPYLVAWVKVKMENLRCEDNSRCVYCLHCIYNNTPTSVAYNFYSAVKENDVKIMERLAAPETVQMMAMLGGKASGIIATHGKIKSTDVITDSDTAIVALVFESGEVQDLDLMKIDGSWKITISST
jgi:hypothetical protein